MRFFRAARALGGHLTVHVVADARVHAYKGRAPLMSQRERAEMVTACRWVDRVVLEGPRIIDRPFMREGGYTLYAFGASDERELASRLADCADLPESMRRQLPYSAGLSSSVLRQRLGRAA